MAKTGGKLGPNGTETISNDNPGNSYFESAEHVSDDEDSRKTPVVVNKRTTKLSVKKTNTQEETQAKKNIEGETHERETYGRPGKTEEPTSSS